MILTAYIDESGTHDGSPVTIMSGFVGSVHQWNSTEKKLKRALSDFGINIFHAKDFFQRSGEFRGWDDAKRVALFTRIYAPMNEHLEIGFNAVLKNSEYTEHYLGDSKPKKLPQDTKYGVCFRASVAFAYKISKDWNSPEWRKDKPNRVNIVMEAGHKNSGDAERLHTFMKTHTQNTERDFLGTITFATKQDSVLLLCADLMAYGAFLEETPGPNRDKKKIMLPRPDSIAYKGNHWRIGIAPELLRGMKERLLLLDEHRMSFGQRASKNEPIK